MHSHRQRTGFLGFIITFYVHLFCRLRSVFSIFEIYILGDKNIRKKPIWDRDTEQSLPLHCSKVKSETTQGQQTESVPTASLDKYIYNN